MIAVPPAWRYAEWNKSEPRVFAFVVSTSPTIDPPLAVPPSESEAAPPPPPPPESAGRKVVVAGEEAADWPPSRLNALEDEYDMVILLARHE